MPGAANDYRANRLLAGMPPEALAILVPALQTVPLRARELLTEAGAPLEYAYFPHSGVVCLMTVIGGGTAETAAIGPEGCLGFEAVLGAPTATARAIVQLPGAASRLPIPALRAALQSAGLIRYSRGVIAITDRRGLEEAACECYEILRRALEEILPSAT